MSRPSSDSGALLIPVPRDLPALLSPVTPPLNSGIGALSGSNVRMLAERYRVLEERLREFGSVLVALSGGVDSAVLLAAAARVLPRGVRAVTAQSAAVPEEEVADAREVARALGVPHDVVATAELFDPAYRANRGDRCYHCRREMYGVLDALATRGGGVRIIDGLNADDAVVDRPGVRAASEFRVLHPLREAGLGKATVRRLARGFGLAVHDKPAQPCLASRLPVGVEVTAERLARVHGAERAVKAFGFSVVRVRCEDRHARIEIGPAELARARLLASGLEAAARAAGFQTAALDPDGYR